jgi:hypothetical protein
MFLDSIERYGLGGINIVAHTNVLPLVQQLNQLASVELDKEYMDYGWGMLRMTIECICSQSPGSRINWQHGDVYLTPSVNRAMSFAVENKYGSELFTNLKYLIDFIDKHTDKKAQALVAQYPLVQELLAQEGRPIVFEINNLLADDLLDEGGLPAATDYAKAIQYVNTLSDEEIREEDGLFKNIGFRLKHPLAFDRLIVHEVKIKK